ncbi:MAG: hypothetical protein ACO1NZ_10585 [Adhaeribacter sp.]
MTLKRVLLCLFISLIFTQCIRKHYFQDDARYEPKRGETLAPAPAGYVWAVIAPQYQKNKFHQWIWGTHYREVWAMPVQMKVLDIRQVKGGLRPVELGGGMQTTSLELNDPSGRVFTLRTLDKDPSKALPEKLQKTFVGNIMRDQTSAGNPYAAFTLPPLAQAAGIYHTNPELYYVPKEDNGLGKYSDLLGGKVVMLEEKYKGKESLIPAFGNASDLVDSEEMLRNRFASNKYRIDQLAFARARLFDVLIGDWDRHEGQWNWLEYKNDDTGEVTYKAVPKDRDQTFYRFDDGLMPWLVSRKWLVRKLRPFRHNIPDVEGLIYNARFLDERMLNEVSPAQWKKIGEDMKAALNDELLEKSLKRMPAPVYAVEGDITLARLKHRVSDLPETALEMSRILAKEVNLAGTDEKETFVVKRLDDLSTSVEILSQEEENRKPRRLYYRVFTHPQTRQISLHGLGDDDEFLVSGEVAHGPDILIYGGLGADKITDKSRVKKGGKTVVYDTSRGNELDLNKHTKNKTTPDVRVHAYDREGY